MAFPFARFAFAQALSAENRRRLDEAADPLEAPVGQVLVRKGERVGGAYLVAEGALRVYEIGPTGREQTLYWIGPGESCILAMSCVFSSVSYPAWVEVDQPGTRVVAVDGETYRALFATEPAMQRFTFDVLSQRVVELTELLAEAGTLTTEQRVVGLLLRVCDEEGVVTLSQQRIAQHVGTAREVVSRILRRLAAQGWIQGGRGRLRLLDPSALEALISG